MPFEGTKVVVILTKGW